MRNNAVAPGDPSSSNVENISSVDDPLLLLFVQLLAESPPEQDVLYFLLHRRLLRIMFEIIA